MGLWHTWTSLLGEGLHAFTAFGLSDAAAILLLTIAARLVLLPVSFRTALRAQDNKRRLLALKPELEALKARHAGDAAALSAATMALYRERGISFVDRWLLAHAATQGVFGLGMYQALRASPPAAPFLWIASLARPDAWLTLAVTLLMAAGLAAAPGTSMEPAAIAALVMSVMLSAWVLWSAPAGLGLYWAGSNLVTLGQSLALRAVVARRARGESLTPAR